jgi:CBS domain-containing protein
MKAGELMTRKFETVQADAGVEEVARKLRASDLDVLPVCRDGVLVGLVTNGDLSARVAPSRGRAEQTRVSDVISPDVLFCFENTEVNEAAKLMRENRISHLPVLNRSRAVVGVLVLKDIPGERSPHRTQPAN